MVVCLGPEALDDLLDPIATWVLENQRHRHVLLFCTQLRTEIVVRTADDRPTGAGGGAAS